VLTIKKILLTGFEPFGGSAVNAAWEAVCCVRETQLGIGGVGGSAIGGGGVIGGFGGDGSGCTIVTAKLPVDTALVQERLFGLLDTCQPDAVVLCGQASGRSAISLERVALNILDFSIPDNAGRLMTDQCIVADGPAAYWSTLPIRLAMNQLIEEGVPAEISNTAGTYLCNQAMYLALHYLNIKKLSLPAGFIHVPALPEQAAAATAKNNMPSMTCEVTVKGLRIILQQIAAII